MCSNTPRSEEESDEEPPEYNMGGNDTFNPKGKLPSCDPVSLLYSWVNCVPEHVSD